MKHYTINFQPDNKTIQIHQDATLLEAAGFAGIILTNPCGGAGRCGKCKVQLLPSKKEVLACQYTVQHDLQVFIPQASRFYRQQILEHGIKSGLGTDPYIKKIFLPQSSPDVDEMCSIISQRISGHIILRNEINNTLPEILNNSQKAGVTAVLKPDSETSAGSSGECCQLLDIEPADTTGKHYGIAVDVGTTSVVGYLINLKNSELIATVSLGNPQVKYGADVISRIHYAQNQTGMDGLRKILIACLNELTEKAAKQAGINTESIYELVIAGNTTMNHLLLGYPVSQLGQAPYQAFSLYATDQTPASLGIAINPVGNVHTIANIAGFVGSDTVAASLACGMDITEINTLLVDIGTNGEIVLGTREGLVAASCAAGPALEGAGIEFGSRAREGAIERVVTDHETITCDVIGSGPAMSICGSGLIDAVAVLLDLEMIDETGRFFEPEQLNPLLPKNIRRRHIRYNSQPAFVIEGNFAGGNWLNPILITQKDIRQFQLAKAAIRAGIKLLVDQMLQSESMIQQILLAGAFGNYITRESAVRVGLLPDVGMDKIHFVGNAAGSGAQMVLTSRKARKLADDLSRRIQYLEIAQSSEFQTVFSECLLFPCK